MSDAGSPHMGLDDYRKMGLPEPDASPREGTAADLPGDWQQRLRERFDADDLVDAEKVQFHVDGGRLILEGITDTRYAKERAESLALEIAGEAIVENRIHVQPAEEGGGPFLTLTDPEPSTEPSTQRS